MTDRYDETAREIINWAKGPWMMRGHEHSDVINILREAFPEPNGNIRAILWDALYAIRYPGTSGMDAAEIAYTADLALEAGRGEVPDPTATQDARELAKTICHEYGLYEDSDAPDVIPALIATHDARLLDEAADRAMDWMDEMYEGDEEWSKAEQDATKASLRAAIKGGE